MSVASDMNYYYSRLSSKRIQLEQQKMVNTQIESLSSKLYKAKKLLDELEQYKTDIKQLKTIIAVEDNSFKRRRIGYLNDVVSDSLLRIFPMQGFKAEITCDFKRGNNKASLRLIDRAGNVHLPYLSEGKLCQYLISFATTIGVVKGLNTQTVYVDEAFGVSSKANLPKIGEILQESINDGLQVILISQSSELYNSITRREIHLENKGSGSIADVVVTSEYDY